MTRHGRRPGGFTLIEVLVALAIVAVTLGAGLKAAGSLTDNANRLVDVSAAQWCAGNELTTIRSRVGLQSGGQLPGVGDTSFECQQLGRTYTGKLVVRPTPNPLFRRVDATVLDADGYSILTISTVVGRY